MDRDKVYMQVRLISPQQLLAMDGLWGLCRAITGREELCIHMGFFQEAFPSLAKNPIQSSLVGLKAYEGSVGKYYLSQTPIKHRERII